MAFVPDAGIKGEENNYIPQILWDPVNRIWWPCLVPTSTTRFASDLGYGMDKNLTGTYKENTFMNNDIKFLYIEWRTRYSLTKFEDDLDCMPQLFSNPNRCGFWHICMLLWSKVLWSIGRTNYSNYSIRVDPYSHQIILFLPLTCVWVTNKSTYLVLWSSIHASKL